MRREITVSLLALTLISSCGYLPLNKEKINIIDSLILKDGLGEIIERTYCSNNGDTLMLYYQQYSGDGVYALTLTNYTTYGKRYTLRGDATNINATVYELRPFIKTDTSTYFLYQDSTIIQLNKELKRSNRTLQLKK